MILARYLIRVECGYYKSLID